jgi:hypothetical protein
MEYFKPQMDWSCMAGLLVLFPSMTIAFTENMKR